MKQKIEEYKNLIAMIKEIDLEKNSIEDIRYVLDFIANKLEKYIDLLEKIEKK